MRMIGIGLMTALLAGLAMLLGNLGIWQNGWHMVKEATLGPQLVFETPAMRPARTGSSVRLSRTAPQSPMILSGLPAYHSATFLLPVDARPLSGYLHIDATVQVLAGVESVLRVSIDRTRRAEVLLHPGMAARSVRVPLSPLELSQERLVVSFSLQGRSGQTACGPEDGVAAVVEIETTSHVHVTLDRPLTSLRDRMAGWGGAIHVAWPDRSENLARAEALARLVAAGRLERAGRVIRFEGGGVTSHEVTRLARELVPTPVTDAWPRPMAEGRNGGVRRFHHATSWRLRVDHPGASRQAGGLRLRLYLGREVGPSGWTVTVTLDGHLLTELQAPGGELSRDLPLPVGMPPGAVIEITASAHTPRTHICDDGPELLAELRPGTVLVAGPVRADTPLDALRRGWRDGVVTLGLPRRLTSPDAARAARLLGQVLPATAPWKDSPVDTAQVLVLGGGHDLTRWVGAPGWLLDETGLRPLDTVYPTHTNSAALLIRPAGGEGG